MPIVRTFITAMAGVAKMDLRVYTIYSIVGGLIWAASITMLGYWLGNVEWVANNIELIALAIVALSVIPVGIGYFRSRRAPTVDTTDPV